MHQIALLTCVASLAIDFVLFVNLAQIIIAVFLGKEFLSLTSLLCGCIAIFLDKYLNDLISYYNDMIRELIDDLEE